MLRHRWLKMPKFLVLCQGPVWDDISHGFASYPCCYGSNQSILLEIHSSELRHIHKHTSKKPYHAELFLLLLQFSWPPTVDKMLDYPSKRCTFLSGATVEQYFCFSVFLPMASKYCVYCLSSTAWNLKASFISIKRKCFEMKKTNAVKFLLSFYSNWFGFI